MNSKPTIAIIGIGRWGKNLLGEFNSLGVARSCFDISEESKNWVEQKYPNVAFSSSYGDILKDSEIIAVVIATPIDTHYELAREALRAGKHVFIEKPMTKSSKEAYELDKLASANGLILFAGFTFIYGSIFEKLQELLEKKKVKHIKFEWMKFGFFNEEEVWNYFPHELAIALSLCPKAEILDMVTSFPVRGIRINFSNGLSCFFNKRPFGVPGDTLPQYNEKEDKVEKVTKVVTITTEDGEEYRWESGEDGHMLKGGGELLTKESYTDPLKRECEHFLELIKNPQNKEKSQGDLGVRVTKALEEITKRINTTKP